MLNVDQDGAVFSKAVDAAYQVAISGGDNASCSQAATAVVVAAKAAQKALDEDDAE
jgi:hypothetical protein